MKTSNNRIVLGIEYLGTQYHGWQRQTKSTSVQGTLEQALSKIADHPVSTVCAGRTDRGVHATSQYVHFDIQTERPMKAWLRGCNTILPDDISVFHAASVNEDFDARRTALNRTYVYLIHNGRYPRASLAKTTTWINQVLDTELMNTAAQALLGEQNFSAFRSAHCQSHSVHRYMSEIKVKRLDDLIVIQITANAFLHHMVRNIVGSLVDVGKRIQPVEWIAELLAKEDRTLAGVTAPPNGLFLCRVQYPQEHGFDDKIRYPLYLGTVDLASILLE